MGEGIRLEAASRSEVSRSGGGYANSSLWMRPLRCEGVRFHPEPWSMATQLCHGYPGGGEVTANVRRVANWPAPVHARLCLSRLPETAVFAAMRQFRLMLILPFSDQAEDWIRGLWATPAGIAAAIAAASDGQSPALQPELRSIAAG